MPDKGAAVIAEIYDAALDPRGLQRLAATVMEAGGGSSAAVSLFDRDTLEEAATCCLPDAASQAYAAYYHRIHPCVPAAMARPAGHVFRYTDLLSESALRRTEFFVDFMQPYDTVRVMGTPSVAIGPRARLEIGIHRDGRSRDFGRRDIDRLQRLVPYLQRAVQLRQRIGPCLPAHTGLAVLETLAFGCVVCDEAGRVLFANRTAEALELEGVITLAGSRQGVGTSDPAASRRLAGLIREAAAGGSGGAVVVDPAHGARLFVLATLLPACLDGQPGQVLLTFRSEGASPAIDAALLRQLFRLTPAEARLALALAAGRALAEIGAEHRVTENTLRTQLAGILRKTDTANQRELVRMLNLMPPVCRPAASE